MTQEVYKEAGGTYDFLYQVKYQVKNTGTTTISSFSPTSYVGFLTSVGYETTVPSGFTVGPSDDGLTMAYLFTGGLTADSTSTVFVAQTNANSFNQLGTPQLADTAGGNLNGGTTMNDIDRPFVTAPPGVPEPGSMTRYSAGSSRSTASSPTPGGSTGRSTEVPSRPTGGTENFRTARPPPGFSRYAEPPRGRVVSTDPADR